MSRSKFDKIFICDIMIVVTEVMLMARRYPYPTYEENEDDILSLLMLRDIFPTLPKKEKVVLGLRLQGFTQGAISRLLNISRTSIGSLEKKAVQTISSNITQE